MGRTSNRQKHMAELYVNGPKHIKGNWNASALAAGLTAIPSRANSNIKNMILSLGGAFVDEVAPTNVLAEINLDEDSPILWTELKGKLNEVIEGVARGTVRATAAQVSMLKYVIQQAKEAEAALDSGARAVIVLPTQGAGAAMTLQEVARQQLSEGENETS